jgi:hypothetical protein
MQDHPAGKIPGHETRRRRAWHAPKLLVEDAVAHATGYSPKNYQLEITPVNSTPKLPSS